MTLTRVLAVGGLDSSRGAGLDADRDAASSLGVELLEVVTADTEQDDGAVHAVRERDPETWLAEARALRFDALKLGLLPGAEHVRAAARLASELSCPVVVDPVLASSSGHVFLDEEALRALRAELLRAGPIVTPNLDEAARLTGLDPADLASPEARVAAAAALAAAGATAVIVKGGHGAEDPLRDLVLAPPEGPVWLEHARVPGSLRGTGCRYATALAGLLGRGEPLVVAARAAGELVAQRIAQG